MGCRKMPETARKWRKWGYGIWPQGAAARCPKRAEIKEREGLPRDAASYRKRAEKGGGRASPILWCCHWSSKLPQPQQVPEHHKFPHSPRSRSTFLFSGSRRGSPKDLSLCKILRCFSGSSSASRGSISYRPSTSSQRHFHCDALLNH